jgi:hypothetical protein
MKFFFYNLNNIWRVFYAKIPRRRTLHTLRTPSSRKLSQKDISLEDTHPLEQPPLGQQPVGQPPVGQPPWDHPCGRHPLVAQWENTPWRTAPEDISRRVPPKASLKEARRIYSTWEKCPSGCVLQGLSNLSSGKFVLQNEEYHPGSPSGKCKN